MISEKDKEAFVWVWLPGQTEPVVAGKLEADGDRLLFNYGKSYLERIGATPSAISLFEPELPLIKGLQSPPEGLAMPGCIRDAAPDAWGRRVIINKQLGLKGADVDPAYLNELTYLLESGSDRIGALDFQRSATEYRPRAAQNATLAELQASAERVEKGIPLTPELDQALFHGSSIGGARPKALIEDNGVKYIANSAWMTSWPDMPVTKIWRKSSATDLLSPAKPCANSSADLYSTSSAATPTTTPAITLPSGMVASSN